MATNPNQKLAVLIDVDNAQASVIQELLAEVSRYGTATIKRAYATSRPFAHLDPHRVFVKIKHKWRVAVLGQQRLRTPRPLRLTKYQPAVRELLVVLGLIVGTTTPKASASRCACLADCSKAFCSALGAGVRRLG